MKVSYSWLKEYLPLDISANDLAGHLLQLGFEVTSLERRGPGFDGVVAAEILSIDKHPNADRLSLCKVTDGASTLSIVCGAKNIAVGQRVPLARIGAALPGGHKISRSKIRGVESEGMICSTTELGIGGDGPLPWSLGGTVPSSAEAGDASGIHVMDPKIALGTDVAKLLGRSDETLDIEITPNRPDCLSHLGLARELSAFFRLPLAVKPWPKLPEPSGTCLAVKNHEVKACPRYMGRTITDVKVGPSPAWLASRLEAVGLRPINNVVDVTNLILMDMGQPLHVFDADKLAGGEVVIRWAAPGEKIQALDGREYGLSAECLVIADDQKPAAIAGLMGGTESSVTEKTKRVFLESAYFSPAVVRKAGQTLRLRSDSSVRFERGADPEAVSLASERAAGLIAQLSGGKPSAAIDVWPNKEHSFPISVTTERINGILGSAFPEKEIKATLKAISTDLAEKDGGLSFTAPSYRPDLATPWDLAEETARHLGFSNIPARIPQGPMRPAHEIRSARAARSIRSRLAALGLMEAYNYDFISEKLLAQGGVKEGPALQFARLRNPLNEDWTILRPTLLVGLLQNAALNLNAGASSVRLFEIGKAYRRDASGVVENARLAGIVLGGRTAPHWQNARPARADLFDVKGIAADLLSGLGPIGWQAPHGEAWPSDPLFHPQARLRLMTANGLAGTIGLLNPKIARAWELEKESAAIFDLDLELLGGLKPGQLRFTPFSVFPSSKRDLSFFIDAGISYGKIESAIANCAVEELTGLELIDVFMGKGVPEGKRSLTIRLSFGRMDRTLKDAEVNAGVERVLADLKKHFAIVLRA